MSKTVVCRCEDITLPELEECLAKGHHDVESVKRYTGLATGPCQGKSCLPLCLDVMARTLGLDPSELSLTRLRPPVAPVALGTLAAWHDGRARDDWTGEA